MCYVKEIEIRDFKSGVEHLLQTFGNLKFDAEHEAIYGMGKFYSEEECNKIADKYGDGVEVCEAFLEDQICEECLVDRLIDVKLGNFLCRLKNFMSPELLSKLDDTSKDDEYEEKKDTSEDDEKEEKKEETFAISTENCN